MSLTARLGETREVFLARVIAAAPPPTPEIAERLRRLLPMPDTTKATAKAA